MEVKLVVLEGKAKDRVIPLPSTQFIIGRASACHLRPHSGLVSKFHCAIGRKASHVFVCDLKSRNGTFINDKPLTGTARVQDGDTLTVGPLRFRFAIQQAKDDSPVQAIREDHVRWLMDDSDSFDMDSSYETQVVELPQHLLDAADQQPQAGTPSGNQPSPDAGSGTNVSAGKYLRDYFRPKKPQSE